MKSVAEFLADQKLFQSSPSPLKKKVGYSFKARLECEKAKEKEREKEEKSRKREEKKRGEKKRGEKKRKEKRRKERKRVGENQKEKKKVTSCGIKSKINPKCKWRLSLTCKHSPSKLALHQSYLYFLTQSLTRISFNRVGSSTDHSTN